MRALLQRVVQGSVSVDEQLVGQVANGFVILLGVKKGDTEQEARWLAHKIATLRVFEDEHDVMNLSLLDVEGGALVVSQFTLYADARRGRRPSYSQAAAPDDAAPLVERFQELLRKEGVAHVASGQFQAHMLVEIHNDGPVTIWLDTDVSRRGNAKA